MNQGTPDPIDTSDQLRSILKQCESLYRTLHRDVEAALRAGVIPSDRQLQRRTKALQEYLAVLNRLLEIEGSKGSTEQNDQRDRLEQAAQSALTDRDVLTCLSDEELVQILQTAQSNRAE